MVAAVNASPNVNPAIAGYDNLDQYGQWQDVAGYGQAWVPKQSSNWAPYQNGSWTWEDGYGWTWVWADPWGWAPYHYGRWIYANGYGWAWYPPAYIGVLDRAGVVARTGRILWIRPERRRAGLGRRRRLRRLSVRRMVSAGSLRCRTIRGIRAGLGRGYGWGWPGYARAATVTATAAGARASST